MGADGRVVEVDHPPHDVPNLQQTLEHAARKPSNTRHCEDTIRQGNCKLCGISRSPVRRGTFGPDGPPHYPARSWGAGVQHVHLPEAFRCCPCAPEAAPGAVVGDHGDGGRLHARADERVEVVVPQVLQCLQVHLHFPADVRALPGERRVSWVLPGSAGRASVHKIIQTPNTSLVYNCFDKTKSQKLEVPAGGCGAPGQLPDRQQPAPVHGHGAAQLGEPQVWVRCRGQGHLPGQVRPGQVRSGQARPA